MSKFLFFLICCQLPSLASAAAKRYQWKFEFTFAPQFLTYSQSGSYGKSKGSDMIYKNLQFNLKRKFKKIEVDIDHRQSWINLNISGNSHKNFSMRDTSAGVTYRNILLRVEETTSPVFIQSQSETLKSNYLGLGYRYKLPELHLRFAGVYSQALHTSVTGDKISGAYAYKAKLWAETWIHTKILRSEGWILSLRFFTEYRNWSFKSQVANGTNSVITNQIGAHLGLAKLF